MKIGLILILMFSYPLNIFSQNIGSIEKVDCLLEDCSSMSEFPNIEFGYLTVPENYDDPSGKQIKIAFCVIKSQVANPKSDPILIFQGGWGMPIIFSTMYYAKNFAIKNRDLILYDYRGSGFSIPSLCPNLGQLHWELIKKDLSYQEFTEQVNLQTYDCLKDLINQGIDYSHYGTEIKTRDAVVLLEQLGYHEVNLYGISNGTMGIQGFLRNADNSNIKIRSILSDSNVPMAIYNHGNMALDYKSVLEYILNDCARNPECDETFPDLKKRFINFIKKTASEPMVYHGKTDITFNVYEINGIIHQLLYYADNHKDIPLLLETFMDDDLKFLDQLLNYFEKLVSNLNGTSIINYVYDWKAGQTHVANIYQKNLQAYPEYTVVDFWLDFYVNDTLIDYHPRDTIPVTHSAPALIMAGSYDPITPPKLSEIMHKRYSNSYYFLLPKTGHGAAPTPCGVALYQAFLEQPDQKPENECLELLKKKEIPFTTSIYRNYKVSKLAATIVQEKNIWWIIGIIFSLLLSTIVIIRELVQWIRKRIFNSLQFILSLAILIFFSGLAYFIIEAVKNGGLLILFGLNETAWWLQWIPLVIIILTSVGLFHLVIQPKITFWKIGILISSLVTILLSLTYGLLPF